MKKPPYATGADPVQWGVVAVAPVAAVALTLSTTGMPALPVVLLALIVGLVYGVAAFYVLPPNAARAVLVLGFLVGVAVLISMKSALVLGLPTWLPSGVSGSIVGAHFRYLADRKNAGDEARAGSSGLRVQWQVGRRQFEESAGAGATLEQKIGALDGSKRSVVSALRGTARMDCCGDANGAMVVYFSPDTSDDKLWCMLSTPGAEHGQVDVVIGDLEGVFANWETTTVDSAVVTARHFAAAGKAAPDLTWYASKDVYERRPLAS
ncbi:hypothetical protein ACSYDW_17570 [Paeniglutamicibacter sp. R2-26]|uniref:hypothetical protein n=1 Tax=Paeniglutamicibacter sp. R2-26 TaxID=3144417 RepID=UPI003EE4385A